MHETWTHIARAAGNQNSHHRLPIAAANPNTIGSCSNRRPAVSMPDRSVKVSVVDAVVPGIGGARRRNISTAMSITPANPQAWQNDEQRPHHVIPGLEGAPFTPAGRQHKVKPSTSTTTREQGRLQRFDATKNEPLFSFGLACTTHYAYSGLTVADAATPSNHVTQTANKKVTEIARVYVRAARPNAKLTNVSQLPARKAGARQSKEVTLTAQTSLCLPSQH